jgi:hypothetical protein
MSPNRNPAAKNDPMLPAPGASPLSAADYARALLADCPAPISPNPRPGPDLNPKLDPKLDAAREWARSGAMALTGSTDGPPRLAPGPLALAARGAALALATRAPGSRALAELDGPALLGERAALLGLGRQGSVAPGGGCRLLVTQDGWLALNLARPEDRELLPAWLESPGQAGEDAWEFAQRALRTRALGTLVRRGRLMGMAVAPVSEAPTQPTPWLRADLTRRLGTPPFPGQSPRVLDLSSLWAGPLCAQLLGASGARVIKAESVHRPDGARRGDPRFFDLLNAGKLSVALELGQPSGITALRALIAQADIVVESARPRALAQMGIDPRTCLDARPGQVWVSITGYGRSGEAGGWAGFGDDAAIAAGAAAGAGAGTAVGGASGAASGSDREPVFCGDAIADPLTGLHAAVAALAHWQSGVGGLLDLSLSGVTRSALAAEPGSIAAPETRARVVPAAPSPADESEPWQVITAAGAEPVARPRARPSRGPAAELGGDTLRALAPQP